MVKLRDLRFGKITIVDKRYAGILVKLGKHSVVADEAPPDPHGSQTPEQATTETAEPPPILSSPSYSTAAIAPAPAAEDVTGSGVRREAKPRRSYARRDLTAEE